MQIDTKIALQAITNLFKQLLSDKPMVDPFLKTLRLKHPSLLLSGWFGSQVTSLGIAEGLVPWQNPHSPQQSCCAPPVQ